MKFKHFFLLALLFGALSCGKDDESCSDNIMNQDETGIDCGGSCTACAPKLTPRDSAAKNYKEIYLASAVSDPGWTGSVASCDPGVMPASTNEKVIQRINYFRQLVGLNNNTTLDESQFAKYQQTALMMKANGMLSHAPPSTWNCWTQEGNDGAASSNLAPVDASDAVTLFINDFGAQNVDAGHRRWILFSTRTKFSYGSTDASMALGVFGLANGNTKIPAYIAYPARYTPQQLVFARWSFSIPGADFSNAIVKMGGTAGSVPLTVVSKTRTNVGDNSIVWEPQGIVTNSATDVSYQVTVSGVANAPKTTYSYTVNIIKP